MILNIVYFSYVDTYLYIPANTKYVIYFDRMFIDKIYICMLICIVKIPFLSDLQQNKTGSVSGLLYMPFYGAML